MFAAGPIRERSSGVGSSASGFRCNRMPIGRCSRNACWAAATDFGRAMVMGATTPGNSTVLRTGTMIRASLGIGTASACGAADEVEADSSRAMTKPSHRLRQPQRNASVHGEAADGGASDGQREAALKPALRQLEPMNPGVAQLVRQHPVAADDQRAVFDHGLDLFGVDAGERHQDEEFPLGLQHVDRRFPVGLLRARLALQAEELLAQLFGAGELIARLGQYPVDGILCRHWPSRLCNSCNVRPTTMWRQAGTRDKCCTAVLFRQSGARANNCGLPIGSRNY